MNLSAESYPRARYLSQQFVGTLCSIEGIPRLVSEIERVIFEAHSSLDRDGAIDFQELLDLRAREYRDARGNEEAALATISEQIGVEIEKSRQVAALKVQIIEKRKLIGGYKGDRERLLPKGPNKSAERLQDLAEAAEKVQGNIRYFMTQQAAIIGLKNEVQDLRQNKAPELLRVMQDRHKRSGLQADDWNRFRLTYSGNVDKSIAQKTEEAQRSITSWRGTKPSGPVDAAGSYVEPTADLTKLPLAVLEAEIARLQKLVAADKDTANKLAAVTKRIAEETAALERLEEKLVDFEGARQRADALVGEREQGYVRVFDAIVGEERVLTELVCAADEAPEGGPAVPCRSYHSRSRAWRTSAHGQGGARNVVNTDADQVIVAEVGQQSGTGLPPISYRGGGLEEAHVRQMACDILEGGELAFRDRAQRLRIALTR